MISWHCLLYNYFKIILPYILDKFSSKNRYLNLTGRCRNSKSRRENVRFIALCARAYFHTTDLKIFSTFYQGRRKFGDRVSICPLNLTELDPKPIPSEDLVLQIAHPDFQTFRWLRLLIFQPITKELTSRNY